MFNAATVDAEEWNDTVLFRGASGGGNFPENVSDILALFRKSRVRATFFILGELALKYPDAAAAIAAEGHEVASHGHTHRSLWRLTREEFARDLERSREAIKAAIGTAPAGYRAPTWSLKGREKEFLPVIRDAGFAYDSSLYAAGFGTARPGPYEIIPGLMEFSPSVFNFAGLNLPFLGGTFLRWAGSGFMAKRIRRLNAAGLPALLYFHTWEFDPGPPAPIPLYKKAVQYYNVKSVPVKVGALLDDFSWTPIRDFLK